MKKAFLLGILGAMCSFWGCTKFKPYGVSINVEAFAPDNKPLANHTIYCRQSLFARKTTAVTDANGKATFNLVTSWDESTTDVFTISADTAKGLIPVELGQLTLLKDNEVGSVIVRFDSVFQQKIRLVGTSNRLKSLRFSTNHSGATNGNGNKGIFVENFSVAPTPYGAGNIVYFEGIARDTTVNLVTSKSLTFFFNAEAELMNPTERIFGLKSISYVAKAPRPDTIIVVKY